MKRGTFIAFEGIDGAGKTTQVDLLTQFLEKAGEAFIRSKEPTDKAWGQKMSQSAAHGRMTLEEELQAFSNDRRQHVDELIEPGLVAGKTVILDRYFYSTIAYQGARGGDARKIAEKMMSNFPEPDVVFLLDVPAAVGIDRIKHKRGVTPNAFEKEESLKVAREIFNSMAEGHANVVKIDGTLPIELIREEVLKTLLDGVLKKRHCQKEYGCDDPLLCIYARSDTCRWWRLKGIASSFHRQLTPSGRVAVSSRIS